MRRTVLFAAAMVAVALCAQGARAAVIFDNGAPDQRTYYYADQSYAFTDAAEPFTLAAGSNTIGGVNWWGACSSGDNTCPTGDFTVSFLTNNSGQPGSLVASFGVGNAGQTATGNTIFGSDEYAYSAAISALTLTAGTEYWLDISDSTTSDVVWGWETTAGANGSHQQLLDGTWTTQPDNLAFQLTSGTAVPEPGSLALLCSALTGLGLIRRKRKSA